MLNTKKKTLVVSIIGIVVFVIGISLFLFSFTFKRSSIIFLNDDGSLLQEVPTSVGRTRDASSINQPFTSKLLTVERGYHAQFKGWIVPGESGYVESVELKEDKDLTVKAYFTVVKSTYSISYSPGMSGYIGGDEAKKKVTKFYIDTETFELPRPINRTDFNGVNKFGYSFVGWNIDETTEDENLFYLEKGAYDHNIKLVAKWKKNEHQIVFEDETLKNIPETERIYGYCSDLGLNSLPKPRQNGYVFAGWYDNPEFTGERIDSIPVGTTGTVKLYAKMNPVKYSITYNLNEGAFPEGIEVPYTYTVEDEVVLPTPEREGYKFMGWYASKSFKGTPVTVIKKGGMTKVEYFAKWEAETADEN